MSQPSRPEAPRGEPTGRNVRPSRSRAAHAVRDLTPASQAGMRRRNLALVMQVVAAEETVSRAGVAARTGLTRATVSSLVEELLDARLLAERGPEALGRPGRPGSALVLSDVGPAGLGAEVGPDHMAVCVADLRGEVRVRIEEPVDNRGVAPEDVAARLAELLRRAAAEAGAADLWPHGVTVALPGLLRRQSARSATAPDAPDRPPLNGADGANGGASDGANGGATDANGERPVPDIPAAPTASSTSMDSTAPTDSLVVVEKAPNLGWTDVPFAVLLRAALGEALPGVRIGVENEANLSALAELWLGGRPWMRDFVHVSGEVGIGAGLVVGGRLFRGARGFAGELGHLSVRPRGERCGCGSRGCLERYAGEDAMLRAAGLDPAEVAHRHPGRGERIRLLASRAEAGEEATLAALARAGQALGVALAGAVNLVDPEAVVLGGAHAELSRWLLPAVEREMRRRVTARPWRAEWLSASVLGRDGALLGAANTAVRELLADPTSGTVTAARG
ncbi:ROK family protein [Allostreptomyces psammosilenae]|uniref:Putative NBD/HSP70 family sugar kinase n=1 Tax=Allostreptomyces psammosilenae TaxID=1892865 RepID=A0A853A6N8_9ACTN|nr:ROK family protein [Allostreptomyces psammosilenae]NYI06341.1 putative NBD/HSP70 family sugar kinase [Allostreptomyces psammosilenae]